MNNNYLLPWWTLKKQLASPLKDNILSYNSFCFWSRRRSENATWKNGGLFMHMNMLVASYFSEKRPNEFGATGRQSV
jgi:hypothetical protein